MPARARAAWQRQPGRRAVAALLAFAVVAACGPPPAAVQELRGSAMGTTWSVQVDARLEGVQPGIGGEDARPVLGELVVARLEALEQSMSTWRADSELSRFNQSSGGDWFPVSAELCIVVATALDISRASGGAFDMTVGPVVDLWGFGPPERTGEPPSHAAILAARREIGYERVTADCARPAIEKSGAGIHIDLSAIAKGYAVDAVAELLDERGIADYLVEIGGELRARGRHPAGRSWSVGIELPEPGAPPVRVALPLDDRAVATSGGYRNFYEADGRVYSHTIDPRTAAPVTHSLGAVTVVADTAMLADGWATALLVLGPDEGPRLAEDLGLAAYFQSQRSSDPPRMTAAFRRILDASAFP